MFCNYQMTVGESKPYTFIQHKGRNKFTVLIEHELKHHCRTCSNRCDWFSEWKEWRRNEQFSQKGHFNRIRHSIGFLFIPLDLFDSFLFVFSFNEFKSTFYGHFHNHICSRNISRKPHFDDPFNGWPPIRACAWVGLKRNLNGTQWKVFAFLDYV